MRTLQICAAAAALLFATIGAAQERPEAARGFVLAGYAPADYVLGADISSAQERIDAWRGAASIDALAGLLRAYTADVMQALADADALPDIVQIGNEITPGMLIHVPTAATDCYGNRSAPNPAVNGSARNWENFAALLEAGIGAVESVHPGARIMLHIENTKSLPAVVAWVENARSRGVELDILGLSAYERWQGPSSEWPKTFAELAARYPDLDLCIVEYGGHPALVNEIMQGLPGGRGIGTFTWEPIQAGGANALFERDGNVLRARAEGFAPFEDIANAREPRALPLGGTTIE